MLLFSYILDVFSEFQDTVFAAIALLYKINKYTLAGNVSHL